MLIADFLTDVFVAAEEDRVVLSGGVIVPIDGFDGRGCVLGYLGRGLTEEVEGFSGAFVPIDGFDGGICVFGD